MGVFIALGAFMLLISTGIVLVIKDVNPKFNKWLSDQKKIKPVNLFYFGMIVVALTYAAAAIVFMIIASVASMQGASVDDKSYLGLFGLFILFSALAGAGWFGIKASGRSSRDWREQEFYNACMANGIRNADSPANLAKMRLLADKKGLRIPEQQDALKQFFLRGESAANRQKQAIERIDLSAEIKKEREEEREEYVALNAFTEYTGRAKRRAMLAAALDQAKEALKNEKEMERFMGSLYQKESSWGTAGGIASGIAGPAAGIAAAVDTMQKNAEKRAYNASIAPGIAFAQSKIDAAKLSTAQKIDLYNRQMEETYLKLIDETLTDKDVFSLLKIQNRAFQVSKTGAVRVQATVSASPIKILGSAPGVVDGYLLAEIRQGGKTVGPAILRLPMYGVSTENEKIEGICTSLQDATAKYTVDLTYGKLWVIESA